MPTANPRITITLTPETAAMLRELSAVTGNSQSAIVADLMAMSVPVFERVVAGIKAAQGLEASARAEIASGLQRAQEKLEDQLGLAMETMDTSFRPLLEHAEKVNRRKGRAKGGAPASGGVPIRWNVSELTTPVPVTRGSGHPKTQKTSPTKAKARGVL
jgi:hypothetical protein